MSTKPKARVRVAKNKRQEVIGKVFSRLTVIADAEPVVYSGKPVRRVQVRCECGTTKVVTLFTLTNGRCTSCGCRRIEVTRKTKTIHGKYKRT